MKLHQYTCVLLAIMLVCIVTSAAYAQTEGPSLESFGHLFDGYLKNSTAVRLEKPGHFTQIYNCLQLEYADWLTDNVGVSLIGRAVYDGFYDVEEEWLSDDRDDYRTYLELREALLKLTVGDVDIFAGKQQVIWGKTDGFRVTDVVNPLDYRNPAATEFLDTRIPLWMLNMEYYPSIDHAFQFLIIPEMRFAKIPEQPTEPGLAMRTEEKPEVGLHNAEYGIRYSGYVNGWDVTLNYLYSWNDIPNFRRAIGPSGAVSLTPEHRRLNIMGGTFATILWDGVIRGELAAQPEAQFSVTNMADEDGLVEKTLLTYAVAYERDLFDIHWLAQFFQQKITEYDKSINTKEYLSFLTFNGSKTFLRETLEVSASAVYDANEGYWTLHPETTYDYNDAITLTCGVEFIVGDDSSEESTNAERLHAGMTYSF